MESKKQSASSIGQGKRVRKVFVRTTIEEREQLKAIARKYGYTSMSTWMRERGLHAMLDVSVAMQNEEEKCFE